MYSLDERATPDRGAFQFISTRTLLWVFQYFIAAERKQITPPLIVRNYKAVVSTRATKKLAVYCYLLLAIDRTIETLKKRVADAMAFIVHYGG